MLPFAYEWHWDIGHFIFMGLFYMALTIVSLGLFAALAMTFKQMWTHDYEVHHDDHGHGHDHGEEPAEEGAEGEEAAEAAH